ncbi:MAG TPA: cobalamin-independent methionine synthase II family protein [Stellaceae bacterium]
MRNSSTHILTSHAGSLPRPRELLDANRARKDGKGSDERAFQEQLRAATVDVVRRQQELGIDVPGDGEFGKSMAYSVNYGAWWNYAFQRLTGLRLADAAIIRPGVPIPSSITGKGGFELTTFDQRRDWRKFAGAYADPESGIYMGPEAFQLPACIGPIKYTGQAAIAADIANMKAALAAAGIAEGFMTSVAPGSAVRMANEYYKTDDEFLMAGAEAMREEYKAIVDAGLILQLDDPLVAEGWDQVVPEPSPAEYRKYAMRWVEAINHAIRGLPPERIRFHLCWGSWHGPHSTDLPMRDIVEVMLAVKCQGYSFEAGNVRHEHEWKVWEEVKLPDDKILLPGVVSHATNVIEHPELVAQRIERFAKAVGRERVIAATDCGLGGRVHAQIAWAKLEALAQGAAVASKELWK